jgi:HTH-type transcriptional regulator/antitoxin HipB
VAPKPPLLLFPDQDICLALCNYWGNNSRRGNLEGEIFMITKIDTPISLGLAVRTARKRLGLTQPQLALASGVGVRFIVELEAGKPTLRLENVLRVLHALGGDLCVEGLAKDKED